MGEDMVKLVCVHDAYHMCGHMIICVHMIVETQRHFPLLLIEARSLSKSLSSLVWWFLFDPLFCGCLFLPSWARSTSRTLNPPATLCEFWNSEWQSSYLQGKCFNLWSIPPSPWHPFWKAHFDIERECCLYWWAAEYYRMVQLSDNQKIMFSLEG